jgi:membrane associated rhomboid family serine protease
MPRIAGSDRIAAMRRAPGTLRFQAEGTIVIPLRDDSPAAPRPIVTFVLIGLCGGVFLWQRWLTPVAAGRAVAALGAIPAVLFTSARLPVDLQWVPFYATVVTSMFLHGGWTHLLGNLLFLWVYGNNVEAATGHWRFLGFYLLCGALAIMAQCLQNPNSPYPIIGASGAISGVLGAYLMLFPRAKVLTLVLLPYFVTTLRIRAMLLILLWFVVQLLSDFAVQGAAGGVAFRAHVGGFLAGVLFVGAFKRGDVGLFSR